MQLLDGQLVLSPSDLAESLLCRHLVALEVQKAVGGSGSSARRDEAVELLARRGDEHEQRYLERLKADGLVVAEIESAGNDVASLRRAERATLAAMRSGADAIFQATFFDRNWQGRSDFLLKVQKPSDLGAFSYEVSDTKLARHVKVEALLQIAHYSDQVARLQGVAPDLMHIILGDDRVASFAVSEFDAYYRAMRARFEQMVGVKVPVPTYPVPVNHCNICDWAEQCEQQRVDDDHLSLVAGMRRNHVQQLEQGGVTTVAALGALEELVVPGVSQVTLQKLHAQASLQLRQRSTGEPHYELLPPEVDRGFALLPPPSAGDLFFDMEGDPFVGADGIEYLFGATEVVKGEPTYHSWWGHDAAAEKRAFEQFVDFVLARLEIDPTLHVYHYAPYEVTAMKRLAGRHATRELEIDRLLAGEVFVDLYRVVRQSLRISQDSYSIKKLEPFYMDKRETEVVGGAASIVAYEKWIETGDQGILDDIEAYNRDDCDSTLLLRNWLEARRDEAIAAYGEVARPTLDKRELSEERQDLDSRIDAAFSALTADVPEVNPSPEQCATRLLARLLEWHRRERRSEWWRYFELRKMSDSELFQDREALAGLEYSGVADSIKQSDVHRYTFDPSQDHKITTKTPLDPRTELSAGEVIALDDENGEVLLKRSRRSEAPHPTALIPGKPIPGTVQQQALLDIGESAAVDGIDGDGPFRSARDIVLRRPPRLRSGQTIAAVVAESQGAADALGRIATDLDRSALAVQGPPGSGKTYSGAEMVLSLVRAGQRVAVTAFSHKTIGNFLDTVAARAVEAELDVRILQKAEKDERCATQSVVCTQDNREIDRALAANEVDVVGGTAWLMARPELRTQFDVLVVDEAGQMSLADVLAVSTCAKSVVLLGDPQQLAQPSKGAHPDGAEQSALAHLLDGQQTIPPEHGVLLDKTWRMHPDVCGYISKSFYDARLTSVEECARQAVETKTEPAGTGLRWLEVIHSDNRTSSKEEARAVEQIITASVGRSWTDMKGDRRTITLDDILVVSPYNAQVTLLKRTLPDDARVGTVDKFQGQEAAIVVYSLAASSPDDISRGMEFLYSRNRLNVAVSRARCLAYLVGSPELLTIGCRTPEQARLANSLCSFVEMATPVKAGSGFSGGGRQ